MTPKFLLDTNCYVAASRSESHAKELEDFAATFAPRLYLSAVVVAELRAGAGAHGRRLERDLVRPFAQRGRIVTPSATSWQALGSTLATLKSREGLDLRTVRRSFVFDILIAHSCWEAGMVLVSGNTADMRRIARVFRFEFVEPFPQLRY